MEKLLLKMTTIFLAKEDIKEKRIAKLGVNNVLSFLEGYVQLRGEEKRMIADGYPK